MANAKMKLVWSPKSNMFLYNDTTRIDLAIQAGVQTIALAPDWALGGSVNLLDELRFARTLSQTKVPGLLTSRRLFEMVTIDAARVLAVDSVLGSLEVGKRADLFLFSGDPQNPYDAPIQTRPSGIDLVMLEGRVVFARQKYRPLRPTCRAAKRCRSARPTSSSAPPRLRR